MLEVKGTLAKLLAQEDLIVEQKQVETAMFDVEKRILTLPLWEKAEASVLDMLIAHEVGHALYTPNEWDFIGEIPLSYVNVVEDVRIAIRTSSTTLTYDRGISPMKSHSLGVYSA